MCGELASQPIGALALIAIGYRSLSLSASAVGPVKAMVLDLDAKKAAAAIQPLLDGAGQKETVRAEAGSIRGSGRIAALAGTKAGRFGQN